MRIWIPAWLYHFIPVASLFTSLATLWAISGWIILLNGGLFFYGLTIICMRLHNRVLVKI